MISNLTYWWITPTVVNGFKKVLTRKDLWKVKETERSKHLSIRINHAWKKVSYRYITSLKDLGNNEFIYKDNAEYGCGADRDNFRLKFKKSRALSKDNETKKPSLALCLMKTYYGKFLAGSFLKFAQDLLNFLPPIVLDRLINYFNDKEQNIQIGFLYALLLLVILVARTLIYNHYVNKMTYVGARVRTSLMNLIYEKSLTLSSKSRRLTSVGEMSNLISVDAQVFVDFMIYANMIWSAPLQIVLCIALLWRYLGVASLAGLFVMALSIPLNAFISEQSRKLDVKKLTFQDSRIKMINEILMGIKVIKFYGWEMSFKRIVEKIRQNEMIFLVKSAFLKCATNFTWDCSPIIVASTTFITFILIDQNHKLDANITYVSLTLLDIMRFPVIILPIVISSMIKARIALTRISKFLLKEEIDADYFTYENDQSNCKKVKLFIGNYQISKLIFQPIA